MTIAIYGKLLDNKDTAAIQLLFDLLSEKKVEVIVAEGFYPHLIKRIDFKKEIKTFSTKNVLDKKVDCLLSLGGDGTLLDTILFVKDTKIPVMGINLGRLGFLASVSKEEITIAVNAIINKEYEIEKRNLLHLEANKTLFKDKNFALNDFTIHKNDSSSMITIHVFIDGEYLNSYWADGIIMATSTGSTAYSLSCGGPIIHPASSNFVITPVAPHNLNVRPIVVADSSKVTFEFEGREEGFLCTLDSRSATVDGTYKITIQKEKFPINIARLRDSSFLKTIRKKLNWGLDKRN